MLEEDTSIMSLATSIENFKSCNTSWTWYPTEDPSTWKTLSKCDVNKELFEKARWPSVIISVKYLLRTRIIFTKFGLVDVIYLEKKMAVKYIN